ncbi:MAG: hypothetical protein LBM65_07525 [Oscillospiraceae bacterium]|jgi:hypothetical protein|nr:hypothetical protein [Oscillospiraceae bacterium]
MDNNKNGIENNDLLKQALNEQDGIAEDVEIAEENTLAEEADVVADVAQAAEADEVELTEIAEDAEQQEEYKSRIYTENFAQTPAAQELTEQNQSKNKIKIQMPVIIGGAILAVALIVFLGWFLFTKAFVPSVVGSWKFIDPTATTAADATPDEAGVNTGNDMYFILNDDGTFIQSANFREYYGTYVVAHNDGKMSIDFTIFYDGSTMTYQAVLSGNMFSGEQMALTAVNPNTGLPEGEAYNFEKVNYKAEPKAIEDYKINEKLVGLWGLVEEGVFFEFTQDGTMAQTMTDYLGETVIKSYFAYSITSDTEFTLMLGEQSATVNYGYDEDNDTFVFEGMGFKRIEGTIADAFAAYNTATPDAVVAQ